MSFIRLVPKRATVEAANLFVLVFSLILSYLSLRCNCHLIFPNEDLFNSTSWKGFNNGLTNSRFNEFNEISINNSSSKWALKGWSPNGLAYHDGSWKWTPNERTLKFPESEEAVVSTTLTVGETKEDNSDKPRWPRTLVYNQFRGVNSDHLQYAHRFVHNAPTQIVRLPLSQASVPQKLQNHYKLHYGNIPSGSEFDPVAYMPPPPPIGWDPGDSTLPPQSYGDDHVYPKHIYYGRPRAETGESKKKFSLEIHPAYLVAPLAGLATFGLVSKIVKTPVLLELGLVEKEKEKEPSSEGEDAKLHQHQHQHEHHHHKFPGGIGGPGIIGLWPIPYPPYPSASATASASASSSSSSSASGSQQQESMNSIITATQIPIILGPLSPTTPTNPGLSAADPRPWWSSFAAMIPRLRFGDIERDR